MKGKNTASTKGEKRSHPPSHPVRHCSPLLLSAPELNEGEKSERENIFGGAPSLHCQNSIPSEFYPSPLCKDIVEIPPAHKSSCVHFMGLEQGEMVLLDGHKIELVPFFVQRFVHPFHSFCSSSVGAR